MGVGHWQEEIHCVFLCKCVFEHETVNNGGNMRKIVGFVFNKEEKDIVEYILQSYFFACVLYLIIIMIANRGNVSCCVINVEDIHLMCGGRKIDFIYFIIIIILYNKQFSYLS